MSDYLTRLIERSLGLAPQIEPLIAPIHAPSGQMLSETVETSGAFESSPPAKIETSQKDTPPHTAANATEPEPAFSPVESPPSRSSTRRPAFSQTETQPARPLNPFPKSEGKSPIKKKDDQPHPIESRPKVRSHQKSLVSPPKAADISVVSTPSPATPPLPHATRLVSNEKNQIKPATSRLVPALESSPKKPPSSLPRVTTKGLKRTTQIFVQPDIISPLKQAANPQAVSLLQPSPKEPPAIHVTIGRVDVRAVMPHVAAAKPAAQTAPKLSLEDYLKQRNGGRS